MSPFSRYSMLVPEGDVYIMPGYVDMRKAVNGLTMLAASYGMDVYDGSYFVFCGKSRRSVKIVYWEVNGFCLWQKKLAKENFKWPQDASEVKKFSSRELRWLLDGLDPIKTHGHRKLRYEILL